jgi:hypothetical protein
MDQIGGIDMAYLLSIVTPTEVSFQAQYTFEEWQTEGIDEA